MMPITFTHRHGVTTLKNRSQISLVTLYDEPVNLAHITLFNGATYYASHDQARALLESLAEDGWDE